MKKQEIIALLDKPLDFDQVKKDFIQLWNAIFDMSLGEVNYLKLSDEEEIHITDERLLAYMMIGVARVLSKNTGPCPDGAEGYWAAACNFLEDMPVKEGETVNYTVKITSEVKTT